MNVARVSRTARPEGAPYAWIPYRAGRERVFDNELDACLQERCPTQVEYDGAWGDIEALIDLAERGRLHLPYASDATPVRLDPDLWEIRWSRPRSEDRLRIYHGEPAAHPEMIVGLKAHWKWWAERSTAAEVDSAQDAQMREAADRFTRGGYR